MPDFASLLRNRRLFLLGIGVLLTVLIVGILTVSRGRFSPRAPLIDSPKLALEGLESQSLYFNGRAKPWLLSLRPELLKAEDRDPESERSRSFPQAVENWKLFRRLDHEYHFDALLLVGDPSEYKPLLDHLVETKDWTLRYVDHTSMVFRRDNGRPWQVVDFAKVEEHFAGSSGQERAEVLAQAALRLIAAKQSESGKTLLDAAAGLAPREPHVANALAVYYISRGEWTQAAQQVERALSVDQDFLPALATRTQLLYGMRRFSEAYDLSTKLIAKVPNDPNLLFYHAKIAHEAHAYQAEVAALGTLIKQAEADGRQTGGYLLYLGQAYTSMGDAQKAIEAFMLALNDPDLPADQRAFARENIARIKKRTGL